MHTLPVFLRVKEGKMVQMVLKGRSVAPNTQVLMMAPQEAVLTFDPVPLGDMSPPSQTYTLYNRCVNLNFNLDGCL